MNSLEHLEKITNNLPLLTIKEVFEDKSVSYDTVHGSSIANTLLSIESIAIANVIFSVGTSIAKHTHEEDEWMLIHEGGISIEIEGIDPSFIKRLKSDGDTYFLGIGDYIYIPGGLCHSVKSSGGAKIVAITMPRSEVFPNGG